VKQKKCLKRNVKLITGILSVAIRKFYNKANGCLTFRFHLIKGPVEKMDQMCLTMCCDTIPCCCERVREKHPQISFIVYGSTVGCWVKRGMASRTGKAEFLDLTCSGCPVSAVGPEMLQHNDITCENRRITT
jgi:hypothetical protein